MDSGNGESILRKRKSEDIEIEDDGNEKSCDTEAKRTKYDDQDSHNDGGTLLSSEILKQSCITNQDRSAAARWQADRTQ